MACTLTATASTWQSRSEPWAESDRSRAAWVSGFRKLAGGWKEAVLWLDGGRMVVGASPVSFTHLPPTSVSNVPSKGAPFLKLCGLTRIRFTEELGYSRKHPPSGTRILLKRAALSIGEQIQKNRMAAGWAAIPQP